MKALLGSASLALILLSAPAAHAQNWRVRVAPPAAPVEVVPVAPHPGWVWTAGYHRWNGHAHVWAPGRYVAPRAGMHWEAHRWDTEPGGFYRYHPGGWRR